MGDCSNKISNICNESQNAKCVDYEGNLGENSKIVTECVTQHMVNHDMYQILDKVVGDINTNLPRDNYTPCINYPVIEGRVTLSSMVTKHMEEICDLKDRTLDIEEKDYSDLNIVNFGLNLRCLEAPCGNQITNLKQLLQAVIDKVCNVTPDTGTPGVGTPGTGIPGVGTPGTGS